MAKDSVLPEQLKTFAPYYALALAVLCFYGNVYDNALLYDDEFLILHNQYLQSPHFLGRIFTSYLFSGSLLSSQFYRPVQTLLYLGIYQLGGPTLLGFHLLNVGLHIANACMVYALGRRLNFDRAAVFIAALLWALHPVHTEAVTYMSGTADPLYTFFCLCGLAVLLPDFSPRRFLFAAPLFTLGLLSKETAIVFPLLVMCCMYLVLPEKFNLQSYARTWPLWLVAGFYMGLRIVFMPFSGAEFLASPTMQRYATHLSLRLYTFFSTVPSYLGVLLWPVGLHMDRDFKVYSGPWGFPVIGGVFLVFAAAAQIVWSKGKRGLPLSWGLLWFACAQIPQTGILMPVNGFFYEHWLYLPSIGLFLGVAQTIASAPGKNRRTVFLGAGCFIGLLLGVMTYQQNMVWHDPITFYTNILSHGETSVHVRTNLAKAYIENGEDDKAMEQLQTAVAYNDLVASARENLAALYLKRGDSQEAIAQLKRALEIDPGYVDAYDSLAVIYDYIGDRENAGIYRAKAAEIRKKFAL